MKTNAPIFQRLLGLETEYAIRFRPYQDGPPVKQIELYRSLLEKFRERLPTATGSVLEEKHFTANGGTIGFERVLHSGGFGLIEAATPECQSPRDALVWQRAQDRLLRESASSCRDDGELVLIKNSRDSQGNAYGTHENYEIQVTGMLGLACWRVVLLLAATVCLLFWVIMIPLVIVAIPAYLLIAVAVYPFAMMRTEKARRGELFRKFFGDGFDTSEDATPIPRWVERALNRVAMISLSPMLLTIIVASRICLYRRHVRMLTPFLVSRSILSGSGWVSDRGDFLLAQKAPVLRFIFGPLGNHAYPLFSVAHLMDACLIGWFNPMDLFSNLGARQRMQVCLGDCNMAEEAEYLRLATTTLMIDAIEAGAIKNPPRVRRPLRALQAVVRDEPIERAIAVHNGRPMTALDVQRWYQAACRRFVEANQNRPDEAYEVLQRWSDVLDGLAGDRTILVGRIDWVTKRMLLKQAGQNLPLPANRKLDIKYHELSADGYYSLLESAGETEQIVSEQEIQRAMRQPPPTPRAMRRGSFIREFSGTETPVHATWNSIRLGKAFGNRRVRL
ncbi:Pup deamidase/depupylase [Rosistilla carotiformis]|uniref:Pup deamidase/depupylase n=1 Tax=Rosistilla carotiformis TaxID=2528017 RepID=A0A518JQQ2_9BACT|nr:proteasome accessory factor PafA2 family protein [Rosistilla carotiformis]QDV67858.1 Pup deamidase/depupylase [Rosistilla carotiformis]